MSHTHVTDRLTNSANINIDKETVQTFLNSLVSFLGSIEPLSMITDILEWNTYPVSLM